MDEERKASLEKMVATELLKLAMKKEKTEEDGSYHSAEVSLETEDERRARLEYLSDNPLYIPNNTLY